MVKINYGFEKRRKEMEKKRKKEEKLKAKAEAKLSSALGVEEAFMTQDTTPVTE